MDHLWDEANHLEAKGLQQVECARTRSNEEGLFDLLQGAMIQPDLSVSVALPLPKRHR